MALGKLALAGIAGLGASEDADALFLGRGARGANLNKLADAEALEKLGKSKAEIWHKTGWGRGIGRDREWRYRINDSDASVKHDPMTGEYDLSHPELSKHDPEIADTTIKHDDDLEVGGASYQPDTQEISLGGSPWRNEKNPTLALHELQHRLQDKYGFASGANSKESKYAFQDFLDGVSSDMYGDAYDIIAETPELSAKLANDIDLGPMLAERVIHNNPRMKRVMDDIAEWSNLNDKVDGRERYKRSAGEMEAREVEYEYAQGKAGNKIRSPRHLTNDPGFNPIVRTQREYLDYSSRAGKNRRQYIPGSAAALAAGSPTRSDLMTSSRDITDSILSTLRPEQKLIPESYPTLDKIGTFLGGIDTPFGKPLEGTGKYLQDFGDRKSKMQGFLNSLGMATDFL